MPVSTMTTFFALLALACNAFVVGALLLWGLGAVSPRVAEVRADLAQQLRGSALPLAWLIATVATLGSLYYSEIVHLPPCKYCWFQRILMYPLAIVLGIAAVRRDRDVWRYVLPLVVIGALIAGYHYALEVFPAALETGACDPAVPCSARLFDAFGFISLPYMAFAGFTAILVLMLSARGGHQEVT